MPVKYMKKNKTVNLEASRHFFLIQEKTKERMSLKAFLNRC